MRKAVVDVGSNSVLLVVAERTEEGWVDVFESSEVTGLGTGTKATGLIGEEAAFRTLAAIRRTNEKANELGVRCLVVGTMALRIASNADWFLSEAEKQGTPVRVISGEEEADLGLRAVLGDAAFAEHPVVSVIDPGGNSTELTIAERTVDGFRRSFVHSFPVGALGLLDGPLADESPDPGARLTAVCMLDEAIRLEHPPQLPGAAIALGATPTNLASIMLGLGAFDHRAVHGTYLDYATVSNAVIDLCGMSLAERGAIPAIEPGREGTLHAGALILERFLNALHVEGCYVSSRGWRHALAHDL